MLTKLQEFIDHESNLTNLIDVFVPGRPYAKQSFRFSRRGTYQTENIKAWQKTIGYKAREAYKEDPVESSILAWLEFYLTKDLGDIDNLSKAVLDGLQGIVYKNDKKIAVLVATKQKSKSQGVRIRIMRIR